MLSASFSLSNVRLQARAMIEQIVCELLEEGYAQDKAYRIALSQTEAWATAQRTGDEHQQGFTYHVIPHPLGWAIRQLSSAQPSLVFSTSEEAIQIGLEIARSNNSILVIHQEDGEIRQ